MPGKWWPFKQPDRCRVRGAYGVWWLEFYPMCLPHPVWYDDLATARRKAEFFNSREDLKAFQNEYPEKA